MGDVPLPQAEGGQAADGPPESGRVMVADQPRLLVLAWGDHEVRWELAPTADGVLLVLTHVFDEPAEAPDYASGWHLCLAVLVGRLNEQDAPLPLVKLPRITGSNSAQSDCTTWPRSMTMSG